MDARKMRETDLYFLHQLFKLIQRFFKITERIVIDLFTPRIRTGFDQLINRRRSCPRALRTAGNLRFLP